MADKKISALTGATTPLAGTEVLPIVQGGSTVKVSIADVTAGRAVTASSIVNGLGAVGTPSYTFSGDLNTGMWSPAADTLAFSEGGVEAMRITSAANIGIGTTAPVDYSVFGYGPTVEARGARGGSFVTSSSDAAVRGVLAVDSSAAVFYMKTVTNNALAFGVNDTEYWRVNTSGNLAPSVAGKGIDFSANTHAAGMTSELLNWYEEGAWTPSVGGDATYTIQEGYYVRVGDLVYVQCQLLLNVLGTGSTTTISGLPFQAFSPSNSSRGTGSVWYCGNLATGVTTITPGVTPAGQTITFGGFTVLGAGTTMSVPLTVFQNGTRVDFSLVYRAN